MSNSILPATPDVTRPRPRGRRPVRVVELPFDPDNLPDFRLAEGATFPKLPDGPLLKSQEVAERLGVTQRWVTDKHNSGHLTGYRLPGSNRLRFDWTEVVACLDRSEG